MAKTCICKDPEAAALFYDELSSIVATGDLDKRIVVCCLYFDTPSYS